MYECIYMPTKIQGMNVTKYSVIQFWDISLFFFYANPYSISEANILGFTAFHSLAAGVSG